MEEQILENINRLRQEFFGEDPESQKLISEWERQAREAIRISNAARRPDVRFILREAKRRIALANNLLLNNRKLTEKDRDMVFERRDSYEWIVSLYENADKTLMSLRKEVDQELA